MKVDFAGAYLRRLSVSALGAILLASTWAGSATALPYDNTNPGSTACGNGTQTIYTIGKRTAASPKGSSGIAVPIMAGSTKIGTVEIRHSRYCATVWAKVYNLSGSTTQIKEAIVTYSDSNGSGRTEHWKTCCDSVANNGNYTSNQYRDRASFSARGGILYNGTWYYAETARSVAWVQFVGNFANNPYACQHSFIWPCQRWPTTAGGGANGNSIGLYYFKDSSLASMPTSTGGTLDVRSDVDFMFTEFNAVPGGSPVFSVTLGNEDVLIYATSLANVAETQTYDNNNDDLYDYAEVRLSTNSDWDTHDSARGALCHEYDHLMGLNHVWWDDINNIDNVGSKATCIGMGSGAGPLVDDEQALAAVYSGVAP